MLHVKSLRAYWSWGLALGLAMFGGALTSPQNPPQNLTATSTPDAPQSSQVSGDVLAPQAGRVLVQWLPDSFADAGFNVYRGESPNGPWTQLNTAPIAQTFIWDSPPRQATTYYYAIFAAHADGTQDQDAALVGVSLP